jgi:hypothetical protein
MQPPAKRCIAAVDARRVGLPNNTALHSLAAMAVASVIRRMRRDTARRLVSGRGFHYSRPTQMQDLSYHLAFARRLRRADGLHPAVAEALNRHPTLVALTASLAMGPIEERKRLSFLGRLFSRGAHAGRWHKVMIASNKARPEFALRLLAPSPGGPGAMARLAMALGALSYEVCAAHPFHVAVAPPDPVGQDRAVSRMLLTMTIPNAPGYAAEWAPVLELDSQERDWKIARTHLDGALEHAGARPGVDALARWGKAVATEVKSWGSGPPPSLGVGDDVVAAQSQIIAENDQQAVRWVVALSNALAQPLLTTAPADDASAAIRALIVTPSGDLQPITGLIGDVAAGWQWLSQYRSVALDRGRNEKPAFVEGHAPPRNNAHTGMMQLSDLPPELPVSMPPEVVGGFAPPLPAMTQELSLAAVQSALDIPAPPAMTQELSLAQIESEMAAPGVGRGFGAPALTQEVSLADIQAATEELKRS